MEGNKMMIMAVARGKLSNTSYMSPQVFYIKNVVFCALAGVAQWIECQPANQKVADLIPSQGTCLDCRPGPQWGARERQPHIDVSLPLSPFLPFSKNKFKNIFKKECCI